MWQRVGNSDALCVQGALNTPEILTARNMTTILRRGNICSVSGHRCDVLLGSNYASNKGKDERYYLVAQYASIGKINAIALKRAGSWWIQS